jgi:hypothetical protein
VFLIALIAALVGASVALVRRGRTLPEHVEAIAAG